MSWNYRVVKHEDEHEVWYGLHEVYYDEEHNPDGFSEKPIDPRGTTVEELRGDIDLMLQAFNRPVLDYGELDT